MGITAVHTKSLGLCSRPCYAGRPWRPCSVARSGYETKTLGRGAADLIFTCLYSSYWNSYHICTHKVEKLPLLATVEIAPASRVHRDTQSDSARHGAATEILRCIRAKTCEANQL